MTTATTNTNGNGSSTASKARAPLTAVGAITRVGKILDQLSPADRKRVLAFLNEGAGA
jgi:hypothetical protein